MKVSENFIIQEFVPPSVYKIFGKYSTAFIRPELVKIAQKLRDDFGLPVTINNWHRGGRYQYSGYRPMFSKVGAKASAHKLGWAIDVKIKGVRPYIAMKHIQDNWEEFYALGLRRIENTRFTPTWLHLDIKHVNENGIKVFNP